LLLLIAGATTGTSSGQHAFVNYRRARVLLLRNWRL